MQFPGSMERELWTSSFRGGNETRTVPNKWAEWHKNKKRGLVMSTGQFSGTKDSAVLHVMSPSWCGPQEGATRPFLPQCEQ